MMKPVLGAAVGVLALGGILAAGAARQGTPDTVTAPGAVRLDTRAAQSEANPLLVNCGEGRQALLRPVAVEGRVVNQVECVATVPTAPYAMSDSIPLAAPQVNTFAPVAPAPRQVVVRETPVRTVYRNRPVRTSSRERVVYREPQRRTRSAKKSALIIGGSAAGGAGVGAIMGGKSGAKKGAIVGGLAGTIYDLATRNK